MRRSPERNRLRNALIAPGLVILLLVLLPVIVVFLVAFSASANYTVPPPGFSLQWIRSFLANEPLTDALFRVSIPLALVTAVVATVIGTLAAIGMARSDFRGKRAFEILFVAPVIFPQILLGVGLFLMYARLGISPSLPTLAAGHVLIGTPYVVRTVSAGLRGLDPRLEEAARNLGAHPAFAFTRVALPLLRTSILSGAVFAFIASFSDINLALFLAASDAATLPVQLLAQMQYQNDPTIAAASVVQIAIIGILVLVVQITTGRRRA